MTLRVIRLLAGALALAAAATRADATTYYVANGGSDSNPGTSGAPFASIQAGINAAHAGDTIIVNNGTYGCPGGQDSMAASINSSGSAGAWITLQAANSGGAVLDGQSLCHSYIALGGAAAYWVIKGFDIRNTRWSAIWSNSMGGKNILIQGNVIHNIGNRSETADTGIVGIYTDNGASNFKIDGNVFHDVGRTGGQTGTHDHSIYSHGAAMIITNNVFYNVLNGWHIQTAVGFGGTIANNTFYGPDPYPGTVGQIMLWDPNTNVIIRNNIFYNPTSIAVTTYALSITGSCSVDHNIVYNAGGSVGIFASLPAGCSETSEKVNVDPKMVNPGGHDFHLAAGSPAIDAGAAVSGVTTDFAGAARPQGAGFDIGAYEYGAGGGGGGTIGGGGAGGGITVPSPGRVGIVPVSPPATTVVPAPSGAVTGKITGTTAPSAASVSATAAAGCVTDAAAWQNVPFASKTGSATVQFQAKPSAANIDGVIGVSKGPAAAYSSLAAAVRFNNAGRIDARSGGAYAATTAVPYSAGVVYRFRLVISLSSRTYSAYVTAGSGAEQTIGLNLAFRTEQAAVTSLDDVGMFASSGSQTVCAVSAQ